MWAWDPRPTPGGGRGRGSLSRINTDTRQMYTVQQRGAGSPSLRFRSRSAQEPSCHHKPCAEDQTVTRHPCCRGKSLEEAPRLHRNAGAAAGEGNTRITDETTWHPHPRKHKGDAPTFRESRCLSYTDSSSETIRPKCCSTPNDTDSASHIKRQTEEAC